MNMDLSEQSVSAKTWVVPYWVSQALNRNNLNNKDLSNYTQLRQVLSIEDMAVFLAVNSYQGNKYLASIATLLTFDAFTTITEEGRRELDEVILPLSRSEATIQAATTRLSFDEDETLEPSSDFHTVSSLSDGTVIFNIKRGFLTALKNRGYALRLASDHLKALYTHNSIYKVSSDAPSYRLYLELLSKKSTAV